MRITWQIAKRSGKELAVVADFESPWLTVAEACAVAKVGAKLLYREIQAGRLRAAHIGGRRDIRIHRDWIDEYLFRCAEPVEVRR